MLTLERLVADSHDDYSTWASVSVGFADDRSFVVEFHFKDYDAAASEDGDFSSDYILQASVDYTPVQPVMSAASTAISSDSSKERDSATRKRRSLPEMSGKSEQLKKKSLSLQSSNRSMRK